MQLYDIDMTRVSLPGGRRRRWPWWAAFGAACWSLSYAALASFWAIGGPGFPFGTAADSGAGWSILASARAGAAAWPITILALLGAVVAAVMARPSHKGWHSMAILCFAWAMATLLALAVPDYRLLAALAYAPILLVGALFGWVPASYRAALTWLLLNQAVCLLGGLLWAAAALGYQRRARGACVACGRTRREPRWTTPAAAARWGWWAAAVATVMPLPYAITRWAWALGIPWASASRSFSCSRRAASGLWARGWRRWRPAGRC